MTIAIGTVCSGIEAPIIALKNMKIPFRHAFACENDSACRMVIEIKCAPQVFYRDLWDMSELPGVPSCDILIAGLPCQAFSGIGRREGFDDPRGQLYKPLSLLLDRIGPKYMIFENVKNMLNHDKGRTFQKVVEHFQGYGYDMKYSVLISSDYGVPQLRKRVYAVCYRADDPDGEAYEFPQLVPLKLKLNKILGGDCDRELGYTVRVGGRNSPMGDRHNWDGYVVDGKEMRIGPEHAAQLQGFPKNFYKGVPVPEAEQMKQMGNTMTTTVIGAVMGNLLFDGVALKETRAKSEKSSALA